MGESVVAQNERIRKENPEYSKHELPPFFVIKHSKDETLSVLLETRKATTPGTWFLNIVEYPSQILQDAQYKEYSADSWLGCATHTIFVQRPSTDVERNNKLYPVQLRFAKMAMEMPEGEAIPYFKMTSPSIALASTFSQLTKNCTVAIKERFSFVAQRRPTSQQIPIAPPVPQTVQQPIPIAEPEPRTRNLLNEIQNIATRTQDLWERIRQQERRIEERISAATTTTPTASAISSTKMPQHVVNIQLETLFAKNEVCPITMEPLTKEGACLTPCGHGVGFSAAEHWIQGAHSCPVCRVVCEVSSLQQWKSS